MNNSFYNIIQNSTAHQKSREENAGFVLLNPHLVADLFEIGCTTSDKNHHKAMWILEIVVQKNRALLLPHLNSFCGFLPNWDNESALRSVSKICLLLLNCKSIYLTDLQLQQITEICFDWIISDRKVATKVYAIYTLLKLGKNNHWIYETLQPIIEKDYHLHTSAYKIAAKKALAQIRI